jgi:hypothetical protein
MGHALRKALGVVARQQGRGLAAVAELAAALLPAIRRERVGVVAGEDVGDVRSPAVRMPGGA